MVCGVWCAAVVCWWGCGWCVAWLVPRHSWQRFLCATPRHSWLGFAVGAGWRSSPLLAEGPGRGSPPLLAGFRCRRWCVVCGVWCVVCGVRRWCVGGVVAGVWCGWSLATPGRGSCVLLPATPGWVSAAGGGGRSSLLLAEGPRRHSPPLLAGVRWRRGVWWGCGWCVVWFVPRHSWRRFLCATPRHSWLGFAAGGGGRSSPLLAEGPGRGSPPLLAGVRWRRWCVVWLVPRHSWRRFLCATPRHSWLGFAAGGGVRFPATPGWGLLAAVVCGAWCVVCGVWCAAVVCWSGCGWCVVWLVPCHSRRMFVCATPRHSWLGLAAGGGGRSSPLLAEGPGRGSPPILAGVRWRRWCVVGLWLVCGGVVAGVWCGWSLATPGGGSCVLLPATPGWVSLPVVVCGSPPLLAGVCWRRWCVVCGVWCVVCGVRQWCVGGVVAGVWCGWSLATPGGGSCVLLPATPGWVSLPVVVGVPRHSWWRVLGALPRHSWLVFAIGGGVWCVVSGVWCAAVVCWWGCGWFVVWLVPQHSLRRFLCATPRHSWLGFAAGGGGRSSPLLAGVCWRRWCVVCGVWYVVCGVPRWCVGGVVAGVWCGWSLATHGGGSCVLLPATPGWVSLPVVVGGPRHSWLRVPGAVLRHSWLGSAGGGGVWWGCSWCVVGLWLVCRVVGPSPLLAEVPVCYSPPLLARFCCRWWCAVPRHS